MTKTSWYFVAFVLTMVNALTTSPTAWAGSVFVTNVTQNSVSVIDSQTNELIGTLNVGRDPWSVVMSPDGSRAYVANRFDASISVVDVATLTVVTTWAIGQYPLGLAITPDGTRLCVGIEIPKTDGHALGGAQILDTTSGSVVATIPFGADSMDSDPVGVAITPNGQKAYVTDGNSAVYAIDLVGQKLAATIEIGNGVGPFGLAITPDGLKAFIANEGNNSVTVIDTVSDKVIAGIKNVPFANFVAITPDGSKALVTGNGITVVDTKSYAVLGSISGGEWGIAISADGTTAYAASGGAPKPPVLSVIDIASLTNTKTIPLGNGWAMGIAIASLQAGPFHLVDPFLLAAPNYNNLDLAKLLPKVSTFASVSAVGLAADNVSAAIALWQATGPTPVDFKVNSGATLLPYSATLLQTPPTPGAPSLTITSDQFIKIGSTSYAAAWVEVPMAGVAPNFSKSITVTGAQGIQTQIAELALVPPPVVLIHGLWSDATALLPVQQYLASVPPWSTRTGLLQSIDYDNDVPFDGAEPVAALAAMTDGLMESLDNQHIVGGRVDVIAHSMGGLVARHFAGLASYSGLRNRQQGQFHEIVTLDTPELGSQLAPFLISKRYSHPKLTSGPVWAFWNALCPGLDLENCFNALGFPLAPIPSLYPNGAHLNNPRLPGPNIPGAIWRAVGAEAPSNSALEWGLNELIAALYSSTPPTISSILQDVPNDAIIPINSQTEFATGQYTILQNLSHTTLPDNFFTVILAFAKHLSEANVLNDAAVNKLVACWLKTAEGPDAGESCIPTAQDLRAYAVAADATKPVPALSPAFVNRLKLAAPGFAYLATPFELAIQVTNQAELRTLYLDQPGSKLTQLAVKRHVGNIVYVDAIPTALGQVDFGVSATFDDGGISHAKVRVIVRPPTAPPQAFIGDANFRRIKLETAEGENLYQLHPRATYGNMPNLMIDLKGWVQYSVLPSGTASSIRVDAGGQVQALRAGTAIIEERFGSAIDHIQVVVDATGP